jgi:hypothetical protein
MIFDVFLKYTEKRLVLSFLSAPTTAVKWRRDQTLQYNGGGS